ncbi:P-II family nitrogen regulator [Dictyoglomus thermophilum]|uniref:Nitrogen regulatory protein P-II n=3 Tax=Pseudomonadati TaxID=3379134 RepID=B5YBJ1_DICT6|nr:P-II family nitrogen regulator [Dictyoglomus thermophilum]ACI19685.1 nitrogen regulatory protein P-II [Dictyoglomus thermophilum H-6-12]
MKKIEAIIRPEKLDDVRKALNKIGYSGLMISEVEGHGKQKGIVQQWRGEKYRIELIPKIKIEMVVKDSEVENIIRVIIESARTGEIGDGKIFISEIADAIRIRTGERGENAI